MTGTGDMVQASLENWRKTYEYLLSCLPTRVAATVDTWVSESQPHPSAPPAYVLNFRSTSEMPPGDRVDDDHNTDAAFRYPLRSITGDEESKIIPHGPVDKEYTWALLLPICFHGGGSEADCWSRLEDFAQSLNGSTSAADRRLLKVCIALDKHDELFDTEAGKLRLRELFTSVLEHGHPPTIVVKPARWRNNLCWLWDDLASAAVEAGADFFVLVGDDVRFETTGWKAEVEQSFREMAESQHLPFGVGVVAFRDTSFSVSPTFPVLHRVHLDIFGGRTLPLEFINQEGDPYLFQIYRRWGASRFAPTATVVNLIGGAEKARYPKDNTVSWKGSLLTQAVNTVATWLKAQSCHARPLVCMDVVVPTYRCNLKSLQEMLDKLRPRAQPQQYISLSTLVVVDNPKAMCTCSPGASDPGCTFCEGLQSWENDHLVRVWKQDGNTGASAARNRGLIQSAGDYVLFLDDDVVPDVNLVDVYAGAIMREPDASILVGQTILPYPSTTRLTECAVVACELSHFFTIAEKVQHPPWGVTANLCVKNPERSDGLGVYFDPRYPKSGGGEDVDFCHRLAQKHPSRAPATLSVPAAKVQHQWWDNIPRQVAGWAQGDVLCLDAMPEKTFYTLPNWVECMLLLLIVGLHVYIQQVCMWTYLLLWRGGDVTAPEPWATSYTGLSVAQSWDVVYRMAGWLVVVPVLVRGALFYSSPSLDELSLGQRLVISALGTGLCMLQDAVRLASKLYRCRWGQICLRFDWQLGQEVSCFVLESKIDSAVEALFYCLLLFNCYTTAALVYALWWAMCYCTFKEGSASEKAASQHTQSERRQLVRNKEPLCPFTGAENGPFVILGHQRTGSNLLSGILYGAKPAICMHNEMFDSRHIHTYYREELWKSPAWRWRDTNLRDSEPAEFLDEVYSASPRIVTPPESLHMVRAVGHKFLQHHWYDNPSAAMRQVFHDMLRDHRIKKIVVVRENRLKVYVSLLRAAQTGDWLGRSTSHQPKVFVCPQEFHEFAKFYDGWYTFLDEVLEGQEVLRLTYEELVSRQQETVQNVFSFLKLSPETRVPPPDGATTRQNTTPIAMCIENFDELEFAFRFTDRAEDFRHE